ncbi:3-dehydroquinate synthase-domain-containing protein [Cokeromyces recurvatus]|uniref:3-dehydroquinate synthase-domain-containing protein n=1 Tax=Cokeromyces recurvatus TaxID=90255 RepID=UPI00221E6CF8|nr:3-dehydroquinate synthase-domain-containing protein [Cokeromyces recurvatus]KAI7906867.1 3-dehydroquinate synthase-domain-containing protein [Cokeromyces recurvatus]
MNAIKSHLQETHQRLFVRVLPSGEQTKCREVKASIEDYLLDQSCTRDTCLIALGGGVMGDLVGYVASTFMRGVPFVQIPTTLLAMVDSSIGGKTAIDTPRGKNLIGTFWQPKRIYLDLSMLETLPRREFANGMAEVIKTAAISSELEFIKLEQGKDKIESALMGSNSKNQSTIDSDRDYLANVISAAAQFKAKIVTLDEREGGLRGLLNFGHSIGHAYEAILSPEWLHGECVSIGLLHEAELSRDLGHCDQDVVDRLKECLKLYNLPTEFDTRTKEKLSMADVMNIMKVDKKNRGTQKRIVLLSSIGKTLEQRATDVPDSAIEALLSKYIASTMHRSVTTTISQKSESETFSSSFDNDIQLPMRKISLELIATSHDIFEIITSLLPLSALKEKRVTDGFIEIKEEEHKIICTSQSSDKWVHIYFTKEPGTTCPLNEHENWFEYVLLTKDQQQQEDILQFIDIICSRHTTKHHIDPSKKGAQTTFLTPTISNYDSIEPCLFQQWIENTDAVEFRVDHLQPPSDTLHDWITTTGEQLFHLRQLTKLPIVYTVRTIAQVGRFDPSLGSDHYLQLLQWGHRWGCNYVDLEMTAQGLEEIMRLNQYYPCTKLIASFHDQSTWSSSGMTQVYNQAKQLFERYNHKGVIKLVGYAKSFWDNIELEQFRHQVDPNNDKEIILINMGPQGKLSRVTNHFLSPATHPTLPFTAAPGQLSITEMSFLRKKLAME